jgi:hypothetical protein
MLPWYGLLTGVITVTAKSSGEDGSLLASGVAGSNPARGLGCLSVASDVCCQVKVSVTERSVVQWIPTQ